MRRRKARAAPGVHNFVSSAGAGCHVSHGDAAWLVGSDTYDPDDFEDDAVLPDLSVDPEDGLLTAVNTSEEARAFYISTGHVCLNAAGAEVSAGWTRNDSGVVSRCTTFVLRVSARTLCAVAYVQVRPGETVDVDSDVQAVKPHSSPTAWEPRHVYPFPLAGGPFLCTQAEGGAFTHWFAATHHAIDFRCPIGTPVLSVAAGTVHELRCGHACGGIHVRNLFLWNSVLVQHLDGTVAEYVHISAAHVALGDAVQQCQHIADSGDIGFAPEPHLHFQMHISPAPDAPTIRIAMRAANGEHVFPVAGRWYSADGKTAAPG